MNKKVMLVLSVVLAFIGKIYSAGYIYTTTFLGQKVVNSPVSVGIGNIGGLVYSLIAMKTSPAGLVYLNTPAVEVGYGLSSVEEKIAENNQSALKSNFSFFSQPDMSFYYPIKLKSLNIKFGVGVGFFSEYESNYSFSYSTNEYKVNGDISSVVVPVVIGGEKMCLGIGVKNYIGSKKVNFLEKENISGNGMIFSGVIRFGNTIFGVSYSGQSEVVVKNNIVEEKTSLPQSLCFSVRYDFELVEDRTSSAYFETNTIEYSKIKVGDFNAGFSDVIITSLGVEKILSDSFILRVGFFL